MATKPADKPEWATAGEIDTPLDAKQEQGWVSEKPPYQWFNWIHFWTYEWLIYLELVTDILLRNEASFVQQMLFDIVQRETDAFFGDSGFVSFIDSNTIEIAKGSGLHFQTPNQVRTYIPDDVQMDITAPHGSLDRIDIVVIKAFDDDSTNEAEILIVAGSPNVSPVAPATPAGYLRFASIYVTAVTGIANQNAITDERAILDTLNLSLNRTLTGINTFDSQIVLTEKAAASVATPPANHVAVFLDTDNILKRKDENALVTPLGSLAGWDAIVGSSVIATHPTLGDALDDAAPGWRILVQDNEDLATSLTIDTANIYIEGAPDVTFTDDGAATGLIIDAAGVRIKSMRFVDFTSAIQINDGNNFNYITECRFSNCTTDIDDQNTAPNNVMINNIEE